MESNISITEKEIEIAKQLFKMDIYQSQEYVNLEGILLTLIMIQKTKLLYLHLDNYKYR